MSSRLDDAAAAALWMLALERDSNREHMGALYSEGDAYARTPTVTSHGRAGVKGSLTVPTGTLRGLFHNHPAARGDDRNRARLSDDDKAQARVLGVPSYISAGDRVRRFDPRTNETADVLAEFPWNEFKQWIDARYAR